MAGQYDQEFKLEALRLADGKGVRGEVERRLVAAMLGHKNRNAPIRGVLI